MNTKHFDEGVHPIEVINKHTRLFLREILQT